MDTNFSLYITDKAGYINTLRARTYELDSYEPLGGDIIDIDGEIDIDAIIRDGIAVGKPGYSLDDYSDFSVPEWDCYYYM